MPTLTPPSYPTLDAEIETAIDSEFERLASDERPTLIPPPAVQLELEVASMFDV